MEVRIYENYDDMSKAVADLILRQVRQKPDSLLCFPSGDSPTGVLKYLAGYSAAGQIDLATCYFAGLDEWVGMDGSKEGSCRHYLDRNLFHPLGIKPERILFFDGLAADLDRECARVDEWLKEKGPIDLMLVGLGMNGHIGLNEPGTDFSVYSHHSVLQQITKKVAQKYFKQETSLQEGITLGLRHFAESGTPVLIAGGLKKAAIIAQSLEGGITTQVPASIVQSLPNGYVFLDQEAASLLNRKAG
ncbi:MAG TPA: glucosamine-6-phosphate deaminase [Puia sp.]